MNESTRRALRARLRGMTSAELDAQKRARVDELASLRAEAGGSFSTLTGDANAAKRARVQDLIEEVQEVEETYPSDAPARDEHGHLRRMIHPASPGLTSGSGPGAHSASRGWRKGHWSTPFARDHGQKDLTPSGSVTVPSLTTGVVPIEDRPPRLLDVIPSDRLADTDQYAYLREAARVHAAAETARGAKKPTSTYQVEKVEDRVRTIAHISEPIDRVDLADTNLLNSYLDGALRAGVSLRLDGQILNGDGTGEDLTGLAATSGIQLQTFDTDFLTTARKALTLLQDVEIEAGVYVLSPAMWEELELLTVGSQESYALDRSGDRLPISRAEQRLWDQPVVVTTALTGTDAYLADFRGSTHMWERESVQITWSENIYDPDKFGAGAGGSDFEANQIRFRAEGRFGFGVLRPDGVVQFATSA